MKWAVDNFTS